MNKPTREDYIGLLAGTGLFLLLCFFTGVLFAVGSLWSSILAAVLSTLVGIMLFKNVKEVFNL